MSARGETWPFLWRAWLENFEWLTSEARKRRIPIAQLLNELIAQHRRKAISPRNPPTPLTTKVQ